MIKVTDVTRDWLRILPLLPLNLHPPHQGTAVGLVFPTGKISHLFLYPCYRRILLLWANTEPKCLCCKGYFNSIFGLKVPGLLPKARGKHSCCSSTTLICMDSILLPGEANPELDILLHWSEKDHRNWSLWCPSAPSEIFPTTFAKLFGHYSLVCTLQNSRQMTHEEFSYQCINSNID